MLGSDAVFGGRKLYFSQHGDYEMLDYRYALENELIPQDYKVWWGYEDQKLFAFAKEKLLELADKEEPFNLTMLTVDTHFEDGYLCEQCPDIFGDDRYANVMACSSAQIDEFIKWVQQQEFYENTTIVLMGDHPTMDSNFCNDIDDGYVRKVYTLYINSAVEVAANIKRNYTTFDNFPTTLSALGVEIEGNRLGLGSNLFSDVQTLSEKFEIDIEEKEIRKKSEFMEKLADLELDNEILLRREGRDSVIEIWVDEQQYENGFLPVTVSGIDRMPEKIESVMIAFWTNEEQSDMQWLQMEQGEEGNYYIDINVSNLEFETGEYYAYIYVSNSLGNRYFAGNRQGVIDLSES